MRDSVRACRRFQQTLDRKVDPERVGETNMKLEGEIGEINVIEKLVELGREQFTGAVRFENDGIIKIIYFKGGDVLSASTNDRADSVDEILLRAGKVSREHVKQALAKRKESETLGDALLNLGFITRKELTWARRIQVIGVIRSIAAWGAGSYTIVADYLPKREEGTLFPLSQMLVELVVTDPDRAKIEQALEGGNVVFQKAADFDESFRRIGLNQDAEEIATHINGIDSAGEIAAASGKDEFNVYRLLHAFSLLGLVQRTDTVQVSRELSFDSEPASDFSFGDTGGSDLALDGPSAGEAAWNAETPASSFGTPEAEPSHELPAMMSFGASEPIDRPMADVRLDREPASVPNSFDEPLWEEAKPSPSAPAPIPEPAFAPPRAPVPQAEERWGFDEAQIETARRASVPLSFGDEVRPPMKEVVAKAAKPNRWIGILFAAIAVIAIGVAGVAGWSWWQAREGAKTDLEPQPVTTRARRPKTAAEVTPVTESTASATSTVLTGTTPPASVASVPPAAVSTAAPVAAAPAPARPTPSLVTPATSTSARVERAPGTAPVITNTAGAPSDPASAALRARYEEMARSFAAQPRGNFTVQFELVCQLPSITRAIREGGNNVWFVLVPYRGQNCYRVFWGSYATEAEALGGAKQIPASLREGNAPAVVHVPKP